MLVLPPQVGIDLKLGEMFQPTDFQAKWHRIDLTTTDGPMRIDVLVFETKTGRQGFVFQAEMVEAFKKATIEHSTGIHVVGSLERIRRDN